MSSCLVPAKQVWRGLSARLGLRRTTGAGLGRLRKEVRMCEYSDVHVMWEMLSKPSGVRDGRRPTAGAGAWRKAAAVAAAWSRSRLASCCCAL